MESKVFINPVSSYAYKRKNELGLSLVLLDISLKTMNLDCVIRFVLKVMVWLTTFLF